MSHPPAITGSHCQCSATHVTESGLFLGRYDLRAFEIGQRIRLDGAALPEKTILNISPRCEICEDRNHTSRWMINGCFICPSCMVYIREGYKAPKDKIHLIDRVHLEQAWPDGPFFFAGTYAGGLEEMVTNFCRYHDPTTVLHTAIRGIHAQLGGQISYSILWQFLFDQLGAASCASDATESVSSG